MMDFLFACRFIEMFFLAYYCSVYVVCGVLCSSVQLLCVSTYEKVRPTRCIYFAAKKSKNKIKLHLDVRTVG
jgi:hypothetical protein